MYWLQALVGASSLSAHMAELIHSAITGIRDPQAEGFIAGTLFGQGWNITLRALDFASVQHVCDSAVQPYPVLLLSSDLEGITESEIASLRTQGFSIFIFAATDSPSSEFLGTLAMPTTAMELNALLRGSLRAPLIRSAPVARAKRAHVFAVAAAASGSGCSVFATNLAAELSMLGKKVLLVDAHVAAPAVASLLGQRGLRTHSTPQQVSTHLHLLEIAQQSLEGDLAQLQESLVTYDYIVLDLGFIRELTKQLTSRRWESEPVIWSAHCADELFIISTSNHRALEHLRELLRDITQSSIHPKVSCIQGMRAPGKRNSASDQSFLQSVTSIRPHRILQIPLDIRSAERAESEQSALHESQQKSLLRRAIADIAGQLTT